MAKPPPEDPWCNEQDCCDGCYVLGCWHLRTPATTPEAKK